MAKRAPIDLAALTAEDAEPMREAVQRTAEVRQLETPPPLPIPSSPTASAKRSNRRPQTVTSAELEPLYFKVPPIFSKRFRRLAFDNGLKLNELLFEALDTWEEKKKTK